MFGVLTSMKTVELAVGRNRKSSVKLGGDTDKCSQGNSEDVNKVALVSRDTIWPDSQKGIVYCPLVSEVGTKLKKLSSSINTHFRLL